MNPILNQLDHLENLANSATPGPWRWHGSGDSKALYLATTHSGRRFVMGFRRWGFSGAQPEFQVKGMGMVDASELLQFEVGDQSVVGMNAAKAPGSGVYRMDVRDIAHPDAQFMAAFNPATALALIAELRAAIAELSNVNA